MYNNCTYGTRASSPSTARIGFTTSFSHVYYVPIVAVIVIVAIVVIDVVIDVVIGVTAAVKDFSTFGSWIEGRIEVNVVIVAVSRLPLIAHLRIDR